MISCFSHLYIVILRYTNIEKVMGASKTEQFTQEQNGLAALLKALAHPARVAIIDYLTKVNACICGDIVNEVQLAQPTVSQHLKELKNAGLIKGSIEGTAICYCIDENTIKELVKYLTGIVDRLENKNANCC